MFNKICLIIIIAIISLTVFAEVNFEEYHGQLTYRDKNWYLILEEPIKVFFAPEVYLDSLNIKLLPDTDIEITGKIKDNVLFPVFANYNENEFLFRNENFEPLWDESIEGKSVNISISGNTCISCRVCIPVCPVGAISMRRGVAVINEDLCVKCGNCLEPDGGRYRGCPVDAIIKEISE